MEVSYRIQEADIKYTPIIYLVALMLLSSLLTPILLASPSAYNFVEARAVVIYMTADVQPLIEYMRGTLEAEATVGSTLIDLCMDNHVIGGMSLLWRELVT